MPDHRRADCAIAVMAKTPRPGYSKTRLCPPLEKTQAAVLSGAFLRDTTESLQDAALRAPIAGYVAYAPAGSQALLEPHLAPGTGMLLADGSPPMPAGVEGFGRCLLHAVRELLSRGHAAACVLSSDTPTLPTQVLVETAQALLAPSAGRCERIVFGGCDDGGYYLMGMTVAHATLFSDIAWSTSDVAAATRERARSLGLEIVELAPWYDVDDAASLRRLLDDAGGYAAPHTRRTTERLALRDALANIAA